MGFCFRSMITKLAIVVVFLLSTFTFGSTDAYHAHNRNGNITIKWDVPSWTPDGYVAVVTIYNYQQHRRIEAPGWSLQWTWARKEVIWSMMGGQTTMQGDCSKYEGNIPHSCMKDPTVVDLLPGTPYNQQIANCCKGGVISPGDASSFQLSVGAAGTTNETVRLPSNFKFEAPRQCYTCTRARIVRPTKFTSPDGRRVTQAMMTWNVTCTYSHALSGKTRTCRASLSSSENAMLP